MEKSKYVETVGLVEIQQQLRPVRPQSSWASTSKLTMLTRLLPPLLPVGFDLSMGFVGNNKRIEYHQPSPLILSDGHLETE